MTTTYSITIYIHTLYTNQNHTKPCCRVVHAAATAIHTQRIYRYMTREYYIVRVMHADGSSLSYTILNTKTDTHTHTHARTHSTSATNRQPRQQQRRRRRQQQQHQQPQRSDGRIGIGTGNAAKAKQPNKQALSRAYKFYRLAIQSIASITHSSLCC